MRRLSLALLVLTASACSTPDAPADSAPATSSATVPAATQPAATTPDASLPVLTVYKSPTCGCCSTWAQAMERDGFRVETVETEDLATVRDSLGMPGDLAACHIATVGGYAVEGHVPPTAIRRMLADRPDVAGIAVPGMPIGSVGMEQGPMRQPYNVLLVGKDGEATVYEHVPGT